ncbi:hypothetical protein [Synoicihabitans lomoniglobus]|uniref:hypothetical protein n=1 Tax=Synoicihabitans lomoniglobus TaxID=2909285 RepID=UPI002ED19F92|nr:hypothetical protein [Opitutaceae bacterium LMO-M01]
MAKLKPLRFLPPYIDGEVNPLLLPVRNRSGVYVIRDKATKRVQYVGESHSGRLLKTLLRHFQFWAGFTAGATFKRDRVQVAIRTMPPGSAVAAQDNLICRLNPTQNEIRTRCPLNDDPF